MGSPEMLQPEGLAAPLGQYSHVSGRGPSNWSRRGQVAVDERERSWERVT
jgi:hypothetical protein